MFGDVTRAIGDLSKLNERFEWSQEELVGRLDRIIDLLEAIQAGLARQGLGGRESPGIVIEWPTADASATARALERVRNGLQGLQLSGRVNPLVETPEAFAALQVNEVALIALIQQCKDASEDGEEMVSLRISIPDGMAQPWLAVARRLYMVVADPHTMQAVGAQPVSREDLRLVEALIQHAEEAIVGARASA